MSSQLEQYRSRFDDIRISVAEGMEQGLALAEAIMKDLESTKAALEQTELDFDNEREARRRFQQEAEEGRKWREQQGRRPFVVALIDADADCYVFQDNYIKRGIKGGEDAADALLAAMQSYVRDLIGGSDGMDIVVRAFANVGGLGTALQRNGKLSDPIQIREFIVGFNRRQVFFDFVDVGSGKERADYKIQESIKLFLDNLQCRHLVLACGHDAGYAPYLGQIAGNKLVAERITLLEGHVFPLAIRRLGFQRTQFQTVFGGIAQTSTPGGIAVLGPALGEDVAQRAGHPTNDNGSRSGRSTTIAPGGPVIPSGQGTSGLCNLSAQSKRLGPVITDTNGRRVDRPLIVDPAATERMKKGLLCYHFYLRGSCVLQKCRRNHCYRSLTDEEFDALWMLARRGRCYESQKAASNSSNDCSDTMCIYGHQAGDM